jgi:hypothetical protein
MSQFHKNYRRQWHTHCAAAGATQPNKYAIGGYFLFCSFFLRPFYAFKNKKRGRTKDIRQFFYTKKSVYPAVGRNQKNARRG